MLEIYAGYPRSQSFWVGLFFGCIIPENCVPKYFLALSSSNEVLLRLFFFLNHRLGGLTLQGPVPSRQTLKEPCSKEPCRVWKVLQDSMGKREVQGDTKETRDSQSRKVKGQTD